MAYLIFFHIFSVFFSLSVNSSSHTQSTVSHFLSLATDPGMMLGMEKTGDGAIGVELAGGGYCLAADPLCRLTSLRSLPRRCCISA